MLEVVGVTFLHAECSIQQLVRINSITDPSDVTDIVFIAFTDGHVDIHAGWVFGIRHDAVCHNIGIAVAYFVVLGDNGIFVLLIFLGHKFLRAEEVGDMVIIGLLHGVIDLRMRQRLVTSDINLCDLGFDFLVDIDNHLDVSGFIAIREVDYLHFGIVETFVGKVFLNDRFRAISQVRRHLIAFRDTDFYFEVVFLTFLQSVVHHFGDARTWRESNLEPYFSCLHLCGLDFDIREEALFPESLEGFGYLVPWNIYLITHSESGEANDDEIFVVISTCYLNIGYFVGLSAS